MSDQFSAPAPAQQPTYEPRVNQPLDPGRMPLSPPDPGDADSKGGPR